MSDSQVHTIRLLVVDDHPVVRAGICSLLASDPTLQVVATAADPRGGWEAFRDHRPDVTLVDLQMRGGSGVDLIRQIRALDSSARTVVLTNYCGEEDVYSAISAGASGYVLKVSDSAEIISAIRCAYSGQRYLPREISARLAERVQSSSLTARELDVLKLVSRGGRNREIAYGLGVSEETVRTHLKSIFRKLGVRDRTEAATAAMERGFVRNE